MFQRNSRFTPGRAEPGTPRPGRLLSDGQCRSANSAGASRTPGNNRGAARAQPAPPLPWICPGSASVLPRFSPGPARVSGHPQGAGSRRLRCVRSRRTGAFATGIFSPTNRGRSRRPCPQPQPRGSCRGRRGLRAPPDRRRRGGSRFWGGQKEEVWEPRFSAQAERGESPAGDAVPMVPVVPVMPLLPAAAAPPRSRHRGEGAGGCGSAGAGLDPQQLRTAAAAAPNRPHRTPKPPRGGGGGGQKPPEPRRAPGACPETTPFA